MLAPIEVATKEHEVPGVAQLIAGCDLAGWVVTAAAWHTPRGWCAQVMAQRGDYVLIAKENQPGLRQDIAFLFEGTWPSWLEQRRVATVNKGHGRLEVRQLRASTELQDVLEERWTGRAQGFQRERERICHGKCPHEVGAGISSLPAADAGPERRLSFVRAQWQLENRVHWRKDVTLREDASQVRNGHAPQVLAALNNAV
jgi:predicted transposase YbfD/YdcC